MADGGGGDRSRATETGTARCHDDAPTPTPPSIEPLAEFRAPLRVHRRFITWCHFLGILLVASGVYWVLAGFSGFLFVFLSRARLIWGLIEFDQVLLGFTGLD